MDFNTFYNKILTDENMMETIQHGRSDYPFRFYYDNLTLFDFHCVEWHWHVEFEFLFVEKGTAVFWAGEKQFVLEKGQGFFVNSKILHRCYSEKGAVIPNFVFIPTFIAPQHSLLYKKYVEPLEHATLECLIFTPAVPWQAEVLAVIKDIVEVQKEEKENSEEKKKMKQAEAKVAALNNDPSVLNKQQITIEEFEKMQLMIGEIIACEEVQNSRKLLCSQVKFGENNVKQIVSGIKGSYSPEEMVGKRVVAIVNLKPCKLAGVVSEGMLLCAEDAEGNLSLLTTEKNLPGGSFIS